MRSYRESFALGAGRRGLSQAELLRRMGEVDDVYETRYSHGTVSRWECRDLLVPPWTGSGSSGRP